MRGVRLVLIPAAAVLISSLFLTPFAFAQEGAAENAEQEPETRRRTPAMREQVYQRLADAQECAEGTIDEETEEVLEPPDMECAVELLERVRNMRGLNSYEVAQMWNFYAFIYFAQDDYDGAIRAYEMVLQQADLPLGMDTTTRFTLTQLYFQQERYQESLDMLALWFDIAVDPGPDPYILRAQLYYSMQQYQEGIEPVLTALELAEARGEELEENWYRLLNVFYYELEDYPNVIEVLRTMVESWPKEEYFIQLSAMYGSEENLQAQIALYELAYEAGWLEQSNEKVQMAQLLLGAEAPVKAAKILEAGLADGSIESTEPNWRTLAQAWQLSQEDQKAIEPLRRAAALVEDGELNVRLAQSHQNLAQWDECVEAGREALEKGDLRRDDQANMILGACLFELKEYNSARIAFQLAAEDDRSSSAAASWITYVDSEQSRDEQLAAALAR